MSVSSMQFILGSNSPANQTAPVNNTHSDVQPNDRPVAPGTADTVTISQEGRRRAQAAQASDKMSALPTSPKEDYPLEAYQVPQFFADMYGGYTDVTMTIGCSGEEARTGYDKLSRPDQKLYEEYAGILGKAFRRGLEKEGISDDIGDYYRNFLQNQDNIGKVRQNVLDQLNSDPRALELMEYFGITT